MHRSSCTPQDYLKFVGQHILNWDEVSNQIISSSIEFINIICTNKVKLFIYPSRIYIILTNEKDENNASYAKYCFMNFFIYGVDGTRIPIGDELYASIRYNKIPEEKLVTLPPSLNAMKMTNP